MHRAVCNLWHVVVFVACGASACQRELPIVEDDLGEPAAPTRMVNTSLAHSRPAFVLDAPAEFYRLDLARSEGAVRVVTISRVKTKLRPMPQLSPEYLLVAFHAGTAVAAVPVRFPVSAHELEFDPQGGGHHPFAVTDTRVSVSVEADAQIDSFQLVDAANEPLLELTSDDLPIRPTGGGAGGGPLEPIDELGARYPTIRFLRPSEEDVLAEKVLKGGMIAELTSSDVDVFENVLDALEPVVRGSIQTLAVVRFPADVKNTHTGQPIRGYTLGPQIAISSHVTTDADDLMATVAHEAAHTLDHATRQAAGVDPNPQENFRPEWAHMIQTRIEAHHLLRGLDDVWRKLHQSGVAQGLAAAYSPKVDESNWDNAFKGGFFSPYGSSAEAEDLAEYVRDRTVGTVNHTPCKEFEGATGDKLALAIPYAKLVLLLGIGAISARSFNDCIGESYSVIPDMPGFTFVGYERRLEENLQVQFMDKEMPPNYRVQGSGIGYTMYLNLRRELADDSPIGLHKFQSISLENLANIGSADYVALLGQKASDARASSQGIALVVEADEHHAKGVMFGLGLQDARGKLTDSFSLVPFWVQ